MVAGNRDRPSDRSKADAAFTSLQPRIDGIATTCRNPTKLVHDYLDPEHSVVAVAGSGHRMNAA